MFNSPINDGPVVSFDLAVLGPHRVTGHPLDLDAMAGICEDAGRAAATGQPRSLLASSPAYADAISDLPVGTPAPTVAARLFADCYDAVADPSVD